MKAFVINEYSKVEAITLRDQSVPAVKDDEVLIEIHAASINQLDVKIKSGAFKALMPYSLPLVLGHDASGVVVKTGSRVSRFKVGDEVYARAEKPGTFAEYISVNQSSVALKPKNISMIEAASMPLVALTVWQAFIEQAKLQRGQKVLIQAGSGGVGTIAIQIAKYLGATVATTTSAKNFDLVKKLGADEVIDYQTQDFESRLKDYDLVLHSQDPKSVEKSLRVLKPGGKVISISGPADPKFAEAVGVSWIVKLLISFLSRKVRTQAKRLGVEYSFLFMKPNGSQLNEISSLVEKGAIIPVVDRVFPFAEANDAFKYVQSGHAKGKVVLKVR